MHIVEPNAEPHPNLIEKFEFELNLNLVELEFEPKPCDLGWNCTHMLYTYLYYYIRV